MTTDRTAAPVRPHAPERSAHADRSPAAGGFAELLGGAHAASARPAARAASQPRERAHQELPAERPAAPEAPQAEAPADARPADAADGSESAPVPFILTVTAPPAAAPASVAVTVAPAAEPAPAAAPAVPAPPAATAPAGAVAASARAAAPAVPAAEAQPAAPAPAAATVLPPAPAAPAADAAPVTPEAPAAEPQAAAPALPAREGRNPHAAQPATPAVPADPKAGLPATPAVPAVPAHRAEAQAPGQPPAEAPAAPAAAQAPASAPATPAVAAAPAAPPVITQRTAPLHHVPRVVGTLLHVAHEKGITHAKISLRPDDLGGIEVRLQSSPQGVSAQLVADSPEAARLLAQAGDDLRRSLEARDVNLLSLEVSTSADQQRQGESPGQTSDPDAVTGASGPRGEAGEEEPDAAPPTVSVLELPGGLLVDVLA